MELGVGDNNKAKKLQAEKLREKSIMIRQNFESEGKGHISLRQKRGKVWTMK